MAADLHVPLVNGRYKIGSAKPKCQVTQWIYGGTVPGDCPVLLREVPGKPFKTLVMATKVLTPNGPNPLTGFASPVLGWHFTAATALDVFDGARMVQVGNWVWDIYPNPDDPDLQQMSLVRAGVRVLVNNTQWLTFDGSNVATLTDDDVTTNYTVTDWTGVE